MKTFEELQTSLGPVWSLNRPGSSVEHVVVVLPSFSMGESLLSHYATRIPALEHRYLSHRSCWAGSRPVSWIFLTCQAPDSRAWTTTPRCCLAANEAVHEPDSDLRGAR